MIAFKQIPRSFFAIAICLSVSFVANAAQWDHVHLTVPDTQAGVAWYTKHFGGTATKSGPFDAILWGTNLLKFRKGEGVQGSAGSPVNHIGFAVENIEAKVAAMQADGVKLVRPVRKIEGFEVTVAHVEDPWGTQIELIDDGSASGFHHVRLLSADPEKTLQWYAEMWGGEVTNYKGSESVHAIRYGDMWLMATKAETVSEFKGRAIDHLGWNMKDFEATVEKLKAKSTVFQVGPQKSGDHMMAFIEGPDAVKIEVIEDVSH